MRLAKIGPDVIESEIIRELRSTHEEADTRILLHAKHASVENDAPILIRSPDTDVLVLSVYTCRRIRHGVILMYLP